VDLSRPQSPQQHPLDNALLVEQQRSVLDREENYRHHNPHTSQFAHQNDGGDREAPHPALMDPGLAQLAFYDMHSLPMAGNQVVLDNIMNEILFTPNATDFNNQSLDINFLDFAFQEGQCDAFPAPWVETSNEASTFEVTGRAPGHARDVRAGYAAFTRSPWLYTPAQRDCTLRDGADLALDEDSISSLLTPRPTGPMVNIPSCGFPTIRPVMCDKMYHLVATMTKYTSHVPDFPSLDIINNIVEAFFVRQAYQVDNWIHVPSMVLPEVIPELGLALVIAGSTVISVPAIWKMGLVLQDVVRVKLGEVVRDLMSKSGQH
jgi:hypothetical protein